MRAARESRGANTHGDEDRDITDEYAASMNVHEYARARARVGIERAQDLRAWRIHDAYMNVHVHDRCVVTGLGGVKLPGRTDDEMDSDRDLVWFWFRKWVSKRHTCVCHCLAFASSWSQFGIRPQRHWSGVAAY